MIKNIQLKSADGTPLEVTLKSTAATKIFYRQAFGRDLYKEFAYLQDHADMDEADGRAADLVAQLAYIMQKSGKGEALSCGRDDFLAWLDTLDEFSIAERAEEIMRVYASQTAPQSVEKNQAARPSAS